MTGPARATARRDDMTATWFDGLVSGRLLLRLCQQEHLSRPDVLACDACGSLDLDWAESSGVGVVVSRAVDHSTSPSTCLVIVELAEGPWLFTRLEEGDVVRGDAVVVRIVPSRDGEPYPVVVRG